MDLLTELKELTQRIPKHNPYYFDESRTMNLVCATGSAWTVGVYKDSNISIAKTTFAENTSLGKHSHDQREVVNVLEGELTVILVENRKQRTVELKQYDTLIINPGVRHFCYNKQKTVIIASTMPYSKHFPDPDDKKARDS